MRFPKISFKIHALSQVRWKNNPTPPRKTSTMAKNLQTYVSCFVEAILRYSFSLPFRVLAFLVFWGSKKKHPWFLELEWDFFGPKFHISASAKKHAMFHETLIISPQTIWSIECQFLKLLWQVVAGSVMMIFKVIIRRPAEFCIQYMPNHPNSLGLL